MKSDMRRVNPDNEYAGQRSINKTLTVLKGMFSYGVAIEQLAAAATVNPRSALG